MYMLDTDICIYLINNKNPELARRIISIPRERLCMSIITYAELEYGVSKSKHVEKNSQALKKFASVIGVADFDNEAAVEYGRIRTALELKGQPIGVLDMLIASHAKSRGDTIITNNCREFDKVDGLRVENWVNA